MITRRDSNEHDTTEFVSFSVGTSEVYFIAQKSQSTGHWIVYQSSPDTPGTTQVLNTFPPYMKEAAVMAAETAAREYVNTEMAKEKV